MVCGALLAAWPGQQLGSASRVPSLPHTPRPTRPNRASIDNRPPETGGPCQGPVDNVDKVWWCRWIPRATMMISAKTEIVMGATLVPSSRHGVSPGLAWHGAHLLAGNVRACTSCLATRGVGAVRAGEGRCSGKTNAWHASFGVRAIA